MTNNCTISKKEIQEEINIEKIEKFDSIEHESIPFTQISNKVLQNIKNPGAALLWMYLQSMPRTWKPNKFHLMKHFDISKRTYERHIAFLRDVGLVEYRQNRHKNGQLGSIRLIVLNGNKFNHLHHTAKNGDVVEKMKNPNKIKASHRTAKKPVSGDLANFINKQEKLINKKTTTTKETEKSKSSSDSVISKEIDSKLLSLRHKYLQADELDRTDEEFLKQCSHHLDNGDKNKYNLTRRLKGLETIIKSGFFETPAGYQENKIVKSTLTPEENALLAKYQHGLRMSELGQSMSLWIKESEMKEINNILGKINASKPTKSLK
jgi:hypothetical protein